MTTETTLSKAQTAFNETAHKAIESGLKVSFQTKIRRMRPRILELLDGATFENMDQRKLDVLREFWTAHAEFLDCLKKVIRFKKAKGGGLKHNLDNGVFSTRAKVGWTSDGIYVDAVAMYRSNKKPGKDEPTKYMDWLAINRQQGHSMAYMTRELLKECNSILKAMGVIAAQAEESEEEIADGPDDSKTAGEGEVVTAAAPAAANVSPLEQVALWLKSGDLRLDQLTELVTRAAVESEQEWVGEVFNAEWATAFKPELVNA